MQLVDQEEEQEDDDTYTVLNIEEEDLITKPYLMEGLPKGKRLGRWWILDRQ